jgi:hypothetical protein
MHEEISAIDTTKPVTRQEKKEPASSLARTPVGKEPTPAPPATHPHKGRLLDVIA